MAELLFNRANYDGELLISVEVEVIGGDLDRKRIKFSAGNFIDMINPQLQKMKFDDALIKRMQMRS